MTSLSDTLNARCIIPVTVEALPGECYTIREMATGTEIFIQGNEQAETCYGDLAVIDHTLGFNTHVVLDLTQLARGVTTCAFLSGDYADTLRDTAIYNALG